MYSFIPEWTFMSLARVMCDGWHIITIDTTLGVFVLFLSYTW